MIADDHAAAAYDVLAPVYDVLTGGHDHAVWAGQLESFAVAAGLRGARLLDVGCGTGSSALPMLARGYTVTGVDVSAGMLERAREKLGERVRLHQADMRALPVLGEFDLIWSVADGFNCLLSGAELEAAFAGAARNLAPGGVVVFDVDTLASFRTLYSSLIVVPGDADVVLFDGRSDVDLAPDSEAVAIVEHLRRGARPPWWTRSRALHRQRHHSRATLERAMTTAGLECVAVWGTDGAGGSEPELDEQVHNKAVYVVRAA